MVVVDKRLSLAFLAALPSVVLAASCIDSDVERLFEQSASGRTEEGGDAGRASGGAGGSGGGGDAGTGGSGGTGGGTGAGGCFGDQASAAVTCTGRCRNVEVCDSLVNFRTGLTEPLVGCLNKLEFATCDPKVDTVKCANEVLAQACPDPKADEACDQLAEACGIVDNGAKALCTSRFNGLSDRSRNLYQACVNNQCASGGGQLNNAMLNECLTLLFPSSIF